MKDATLGTFCVRPAWYVSRIYKTKFTMARTITTNPTK